MNWQLAVEKTVAGMGYELVDCGRSGGGLFEHVLLRHHGQRLGAPVRPEHHPRPAFVKWHRAEVFKEQPRPT